MCRVDFTTAETVVVSLAKFAQPAGSYTTIKLRAALQGPKVLLYPVADNAAWDEVVTELQVASTTSTRPHLFLDAPSGGPLADWAGA